MSGLEGMVGGATARERAVRVAGALAELGVRRLVLVHGDGRRVELVARSADLPGLVLSAGSAWVIECAEVRVAGDQKVAKWVARDEAAAEVFRGACDRMTGRG